MSGSRRTIRKAPRSATRWSKNEARTDHILFDALIVIGPCAYVRRPTIPAGPAVQIRIIICLLFLTMIVVAVLYGLREVADSVDLATCLAIWGAAALVEIGIAFTWEDGR
jgi:hypothetical protein